MFEDLSLALENDDCRPVHDTHADSGSLGSSQTEDTVAEGPGPSVVSEAVDFSKNSSPDEVLESLAAVQRDSSEARLATEEVSVSAEPAVESTTSEMDSLQLGYPGSQPESATRSHHMNPSEQIPSNAAAPAGPEQLPAAQPPLSQDAYSSQASYSHYTGYQQQYQAAQQQYGGVQDPSAAFNVGKMYYNGVNEMLGQSPSGMDGNSNRSGASNYPTKVPAQKQQQQQQQQQQQGLGWQNPMMNSYGMMTPNMYMTPQQQVDPLIDSFCWKYCVGR